MDALWLVPDSQATLGTAAPGKICSLLIFLLLRSMECLLLLLFVFDAVLLAYSLMGMREDVKFLGMTLEHLALCILNFSCYTAEW